MKMEAKILRDLFCFQCSYQFDKRSIYDKHQLLVHNYKEKKGFQRGIKIEDEEFSNESEMIPSDSTKNLSLKGSKSLKCKFCNHSSN